MTRDPLDDLLDRSMPPSRPATRIDLDAMAADARRPAGRRARSRSVIAAGLVALFASGGVGIAAAATDGFSWAPWAQQPIGAVRFTMANGFDCELRFSEYTGGNDAQYVSQVNDLLTQWYRSGDVLPAVEAFVPGTLADLGPVELQPGETVDSLPPGEAEHREWARQWLAWDLAVGEAEWQELGRHGLQPGDERLVGSERNGQIQCLDEEGEPYAPGAGS